ncbi:MAG: hypothetical protein J0I41_07985 [Filimonas sp.]|nr:hypothetical protein [Filimonas sp.]
MKKAILFSLFALVTTIYLLSCAKEKSFETGSNGTPAAGAIQKDAQGNCLPPNIMGTYYTTKALGDTNYVEILVNITKTGSYKVKTDLQNGYSFADSGYFSATGMQSIKLKGAGTPILPITSDFTVVLNDTSTCSFAITALDGTAVVTDPNNDPNAWSFSDTLISRNGPIDTAYIRTDGNFQLQGSLQNHPDSLMSIVFVLPSGQITPGTYNTLNSAAFDYGRIDATNNFTNVYHSGPDNGNPYQMTLTIASYDASTHIMQGTFSGKTAITAQSPKYMTISNGKFKARVTP